MTEELSKNEQKKLAKKAEKAAKKVGAKATAPGAAAPTTTTVSTTTPALATNTPSAPCWTIVRPTSQPATLKAVWAAKLAGIDLKKTKKSPETFFGDSTAIVLGSQVIGGGGNAMAVALASALTSHSLLEQISIDNWCEWERTQLRHAAKPAKALEHLETALQATSTGLHLVGHADSVADVCVATTLSTLPADSLPLSVAHYLASHQAALDAAKQAVEDLSAPDVDLKEASFDKVMQAIFGAVIEDTFGAEAVESLSQNYVERCRDPKHGDYQCNAAMPIFASLKRSGKLPADIKSPQQVAAKLIAGLGSDHPVLEDLQVNGPGFVMSRVRPAFLASHMNTMLERGCLPMPVVPPLTCLVDFSSPNIAKEMHVGHLRSTIIGESVCRILEAVGHKVHRVNHVGDWGTQFGMLIQYLKEEYPQVGEAGAELPNITDLTLFYKSAKERFDESPEFKKTSQTNVVKLQSGDPECMQIWKMLCDVSRKEFQKVYNRLDVSVEEFGESFYNAKIPAVIDEFAAAGKLEDEQGGAKVVRIEGFKVPLMLQKSDGGYGYDSTDMAALKYRLFDLGADRIIIITDYTQADHFKMVYSAGRDIGWLAKKQRLDHIGFGTVNGEDGKRFKTRSGDTVRLVDLLDEAVNRMEASLKERIAEGKSGITEDELHTVSEAIGYGAVKYFDLSRNPTSDYIFSYDKMLDTKGDTAVYLLYARVRLESIIAKAKAELGVDVEELLKSKEQIVIGHESERNLALNLLVFPDVMTTTLDDLFPKHICEYVYKLANAASDFVTRCKVLGSDEMKSRLLLCYATTVAIHECFDLLGIRHVKRI